MSSIGTGYDLAASTFSPDGKIFQVDYGHKAVEMSGTVVAIAGKKGVVTVADANIRKRMSIAEPVSRVANVTEQIGFTTAGRFTDGKALLVFAHEEAAKHLRSFRELMPVRKLAESVGEYVHIFTLGIHRPFGCSVFVSGWDSKSSSLYVVDPSGQCTRYQAWSTGKNRQAAKTEIEKIPAERLDNMDLDQLLKEAMRILITVRDDIKAKNMRIDAGWVGEKTGGKHEVVSEQVINALEQQINREILAEDEDDMDAD